MDLQKLTIDRGDAPRRARRRSRAPLVLTLLVLGAGGALAWTQRDRIAAAVGGGAQEPQRVDLATAEVVDLARASAGPARTGAAANGYVVARRRAALSADTPGRIVELNVEEGTEVRAGDVVARLYAEEAEAEVARAEAEVAAAEAGVAVARAGVTRARTQLDEAEAFVGAVTGQRDEAAEAQELADLEAARATRLFDQGAVPAETRDRALSTQAQARARTVAAEAGIVRAEAARATAESGVALAEAQVAEAEARIPALRAALARARATLDKTIVRAPFDGVVVLKDAEVGEVVSPNALGGQSRGSVATMVDFSTLEVQVELAETNLGEVAEGAPASVYFDAFAGERFAGRVTRIWPTANRQKATIEVRIALDELDPRLRPEMGARVVFERAGADEPATDAPERRGLAIPASALVERGGERGVFVVDGDRARFRPIRAGEPRRGLVEVLEGLEEGARVVRRPAPDLSSGALVEVTAR